MYITVQGQENTDGSTQAGRRREARFSLSPPWCSSHALNWLTLNHTAHEPHQGSPSTSLSLPTEMLISSKTYSQTHSEILFSQISGRPVIQSSWHIKLTSTFWNLLGNKGLLHHSQLKPSITCHNWKASVIINTTTEGHYLLLVR